MAYPPAVGNRHFLLLLPLVVLRMVFTGQEVLILVIVMTKLLLAVRLMEFNNKSLSVLERTLVGQTGCLPYSLLT